MPSAIVTHLFARLDEPCGAAGPLEFGGDGYGDRRRLPNNLPRAESAANIRAAVNRIASYAG